MAARNGQELRGRFSGNEGFWAHASPSQNHLAVAATVFPLNRQLLGAKRCGGGARDCAAAGNALVSVELHGLVLDDAAQDHGDGSEGSCRNCRD